MSHTCIGKPMGPSLVIEACTCEDNIYRQCPPPTTAIDIGVMKERAWMGIADHMKPGCTAATNQQRSSTS